MYIMYCMVWKMQRLYIDFSSIAKMRHEALHVLDTLRCGGDQNVGRERITLLYLFNINRINRS